MRCKAASIPRSGEARKLPEEFPGVLNWVQGLDCEQAAPPIASLRELEAASLALETLGADEHPQFRQWLTALLAPGSSPPGIPSEFLERRPDVRQFEQQLRSANAEVGHSWNSSQKLV
jgi:hypothetical protein